MSRKTVGNLWAANLAFTILTGIGAQAASPPAEQFATCAGLFSAMVDYAEDAHVQDYAQRESWFDDLVAATWPETPGLGAQDHLHQEARTTVLTLLHQSRYAMDPQHAEGADRALTRILSECESLTLG